MFAKSAFGDSAHREAKNYAVTVSQMYWDLVRFFTSSYATVKDWQKTWPALPTGYPQAPRSKQGDHLNTFYEFVFRAGFQNCSDLPRYFGKTMSFAYQQLGKLQYVGSLWRT